MKKILLFAAVMAIVSVSSAQKKVTAYAITGIQKGQAGWSEVRLIDITTGEEIQPVYQSTKEVDVLNARTGKPVVKKALVDNTQVVKGRPVINAKELHKVKEFKGMQLQAQKTVSPQKETTETIIVTNTNSNNNLTTNTNINVNANNNVIVRKVVVGRSISAPVQTDKPFATTSAALAYDKKHERLYYTPMGIAELRYIDLKTGKIYFFENEPFGAVKGRGDVQNQITRMVIASDGNGYAITNDANHLIRFTTGKKPEITDLGAITDDASNGSYSVHGQAHFGGDVVADVNKNLYLVGANRTVFKINLDSKVASYIGNIKGLPAGFTTNGAVVEEGSKVIVTSSTQTIGYYRFDLNTLQAEKVSTGTQVYNASDLANGTLAFEKTKKKEKNNTEVKDVVITEAPLKKEEVAPVERTSRLRPETLAGSMSVFPNPVISGGTVKVSLKNQQPGRYQIQLLDVSGQIVSTQNVNISSKTQVEELRLSKLLAHGNYVVNVVGSNKQLAGTSKIMIR